MKVAYLDSSVLLNQILKQTPVSMVEWSHLEDSYTSQLTRVEMFRTIDRFRVLGEIVDEQVAAHIQDTYSLLEAIEEVALDSTILKQAARPFSVSIKTLDALHLASALILQETIDQEVVFFTYDKQLARAARVSGLQAASCS